MEKRRTKRKSVRIDTEIEAEDACFQGIIENVAEHGICLETDSKDLLGTSTRFNPGTEFQIKFQTPSGDDIKVHCKVTWSYKIAPHGLKRKIGMEIIFPPPDYIDFYRTLEP
jgi:hypothetical protein